MSRCHHRSLIVIIVNPIERHTAFLVYLVMPLRRLNHLLTRRHHILIPCAAVHLALPSVLVRAQH